jgi:hypothetical protein
MEAFKGFGVLGFARHGSVVYILPVVPMVDGRPIDSNTGAASSLIESGNKAPQAYVVLQSAMHCVATL